MPLSCGGHLGLPSSSHQLMIDALTSEAFSARRAGPDSYAGPKGGESCPSATINPRPTGGRIHRPPRSRVKQITLVHFGNDR